MPRAATVRIEEGDPEARPGRDRHALLLVRKHVAGRALSSLKRPPGRRALVLDFGGPLLVLRLSGTPALTLVLDGAVAASMGEGSPAWPLPVPTPDAPAPAAPLLALPDALESCADRDLADHRRVRFVDRSEAAGFVLAARNWVEAASVYLVARRRGERFDRLQRRAVREAAREARRLERLASNLEHDLDGLPDAESVRRQAEALLAAPRSVRQGVSEALVPDPYSAADVVRVTLDPSLNATANADRLFAKARRIDRARSQVAKRLADTHREAALAREAERRASAAENASDLEASSGASGPGERGESGAPRHYLTGRGLSMLVGRGARQNHQLTFSIARPDDLWLHARDAPGAHVILRDPEGRAGADDLREAAEVAAFFSDARQDARVDVHVTRRKHVRPAKGGPGRVHVHHSDTMRVTPRDPEGRLRRR